MQSVSSCQEDNVLENFELCREDWKVKNYVFSLEGKILIMSLGFCNIFQFLLILDILVISLILTIMLQIGGRDTVTHFSGTVLEWI